MFLKRKAQQEALVAGAEAADSAPEEAHAILRDALGLYHLWYLELRLSQELARATRGDGGFSLAIWQLRLLPGERPSADLLRQAAEFIVKSLRSYDLPARLDDERLAAVLFDAPYEAASTVAFRLKSELQLRVTGAGRWQAGVSTFGRDGMDADALINTALRRLDEDARR